MSIMDLSAKIGETERKIREIQVTDDMGAGSQGRIPKLNAELEALNKSVKGRNSIDSPMMGKGGSMTFDKSDFG